MAKEKKFYFNFIDVIIILGFVAVLSVFSIFAIGQRDSKGNVTGATVSYTLYCENIEPEVAKSIIEYDDVRDASKDLPKGKIIKIKSINNYVEEDAFDSVTGSFVSAPHPTNYTLEVEVESPCTLNGGSVKIDDVEIKIGKKMHLKGNGYAFYGNITDFKINS
ncbi:MAG: DUF4330 domain-containing protein [Clostridia bacterium]|nr:DUF4330 domain-containing protein [Clostridia bacterium]